MAITLTTIRDRIETALADASNDIWAAADIDEAIRKALAEYSIARPQDKITTLTLAAAGREIDVSSIAGITDITEIHLPYHSSDPAYPPQRRPFRFWSDSSLLYLMGSYQPQAGDVVRVFYTVSQTLSGLDSQTETSFPEAHAHTIIKGAAAFAVLTRALDLTEQVTLDRHSTEYLQAHGNRLLAQFREELYSLARSRADTRTAATVPLPTLDRHDAMWA